MYKIIGGDGKEYGPVSSDVVRQWIEQGRATASTKIQPTGSADWLALSQVPEFANSLASATGTTRPIQPQPLPTATTSGLAIGSVICGALGLLICVTAPVGLVLGIVARNRIKKSNGQIKGSGLALTGIILSALVLVFFVAALILPALARAKVKAKEIRCINNMKQLGVGVRMYASANNGQLPYATNWCDAIASSVSSTNNVFQCPADKPGRSSYAFNARLSGLKESQINPDTVLLFETENKWNASGGEEEMVKDRHNLRYITVCFADGSIRRVSPSKLDTLRWEP